MYIYGNLFNLGFNVGRKIYHLVLAWFCLNPILSIFADCSIDSKWFRRRRPDLSAEILHSSQCLHCMIKILFSEKTMSWPYVCCPLTQGWSVRYIAQCSLFSYLNLLVLRPRCCAKHGLQNINLLCKLCKLWVQKLKEKCYVMLLINYELK